MAKNLKVQIKNTQLAKALQLDKVKKPAATRKKKAADEGEAPVKEAAAAAPVHEPEPAPPPPPPAPVVEEKRPARPEPEAEPEGPSFNRQEEPAPRERPSYPPRREAPPSDRPPYQRREGGPAPYPRREGTGAPYPRREGTGAPYPRREGTGAPYPRREGGPAPYPRREGTGAPYPRREGGPAPYPRREGTGAPYPRREGTGAPYPRREGAPGPYPRREGTPGPYPRREGTGAPYPRREGAPGPYPRREGTGAPYPRRDFPPRGPRPPSTGAPRPSGPSREGKEAPRAPPRKPGVFKDYQEIKPQRKESDNRGFDSRDRMGLRDREDEEWRKKRAAKGKKGQLDELTIRPKILHVRVPITIKELASEMKVKASQLIQKLFMQGVIGTINDFLDDETTIQLLGQEFGCEIALDTQEEKRIQITDKTIREEIRDSDPETLILRPPVVTFMGHVDHGKTSLIDAIRKTNVAGGEAGAITQHIGAFKCHTAVGDITILDTPGHEAFSAMRARGADVTDLVVLVVAGDEGIREQTVEAINQAKTAGVPILVAINKCDKPNFNAENVYRQLSEQELLPEAWGGTTITVNCSAMTGTGIKELLEMLSLQSEVLELKANPDARARGSVIESEMHKGLGAVATVLVQNGTLHIGDAIVFDLHFARVKTMHDEYGKELREAGPSTPVKITGLSGLPEAGSEFIAVSSEREAREISEVRSLQHRDKVQQKEKRGVETLLEKRAEAQKKKTLNLILRADVQGSLEALKHSLQKIHSDKVDLFIVSEGVGQISESDIELAATSNSTIIGFHTKIESHAEMLIKQKKVPIKMHEIIYHAVDDVRAAMRDLLDKIPQENEMGEAEVKAVFKSSHIGLIAGCQVKDGIIKRNHHARLVRDGNVIWKGNIASLKRVKEDVREVSKGLECGIVLQNFNEVKEGDIIQAYEITYLEQEI